MPEKRYKWRRGDYREKTNGLLMLNTGDGKGKTTAAIGLMVRAAGRGMHCCMIQFMKAKTDRYGEHESLEKLGIEVYTMGDGFTWDTNDKTQDIKTSEETWALCVEKMRSGDYDLLVFDELLYVLSYGFLDIDVVISEIREVRASTRTTGFVQVRSEKDAGGGGEVQGWRCAERVNVIHVVRM